MFWNRLHAKKTFTKFIGLTQTSASPETSNDRMCILESMWCSFCRSGYFIV